MLYYIIIEEEKEEDSSSPVFGLCVVLCAFDLREWKTAHARWVSEWENETGSNLHYFLRLGFGFVLLSNLTLAFFSLFLNRPFPTRIRACVPTLSWGLFLKKNFSFSIRYGRVVKLSGRSHVERCRRVWGFAWLPRYCICLCQIFFFFNFRGMILGIGLMIYLVICNFC